MEQIIHPNFINKNQEWNESYYLAFYSKEQKIGGVSRLGFKPNKQEAMTFFFLYMPDGSAGGYFQERKMKSFSDQLKVGKMKHGWQENGTWKYYFKGNMIFVTNSEDLPKVREHPELIDKMGKVEMNLTFTPLNEVYEYSEFMTEESLELGKKAGDKHWEQIASISGTLKVVDKTYTFNNIIGQRDHTYGVRDWTGVGNWLYYVIWFDNTLALNPAAIIADDGRLSTGGFVFKDGQNKPLKTISIIEQQFREDKFPVSSKLELVDYNGEKYLLNARPGPIIPVPFKTKEGKESILVQSFGSFELNDRTGGYGTFETLISL